MNTILKKNYFDFIGQSFLKKNENNLSYGWSYITINVYVIAGRKNFLKKFKSSLTRTVQDTKQF